MSKVLKQEYCQKILRDFVLAAEIAKELNKAGHTVLRYARAAHINLTLPGVVEIIRKHMGLSEGAELLEDRPRELMVA